MTVKCNISLYFHIRLHRIPSQQ